MTVKTVTAAIKRCRATIDHREKSGQGTLHGWREIDVSYEIVAPLIGALGWNLYDPMECHMEYRRGRGRVDYAIFDKSGKTVAGVDRTPLIIIEVKRPGSCLGSSISGLARYATATPTMFKGRGVLTDGTMWHFYDIVQPGRLATTPVATVDITEGSARDAAKALNHWLSKNGTPRGDAVLMLNGFLRGIWVGVLTMLVWALVDGLTGWVWMSSFDIIWVFVVSGFAAALQKIVSDSSRRPL